jgi:hypothetical protein
MADGFEIIDAPPAAPARVGLVSSSNRPTLTVRWENGIRFVPEAYRGDDLDAGGAWWEVCDVEDAADPPDKGIGPPVPDSVAYLPWIVVEADACLSRSDGEARVRRRLVANTSRKVELEFWSGVVAQAGGLPNDYLVNPATAEDLGTAGVVFGLAELQAYLADAIPGRGAIHCTVRVATAWQSAGLVRREGTLVLDLYDNIVIPGSGYPGTGPDGWAAPAAGQEYAFATGIPQYLEGPITAMRDAAAGAQRNRFTWNAERTVAAFHDGLAHGGLLVDLGDACAVAAS